MELTPLLYFKTIAECDTITQAAEILHVSQPALSTTLRKLEKELGVRLFERTHNRIKLNEAGQLALVHVKSILMRVEQMKSELSQYSDNENVFSIAFCDPGPQWFFIPKFSMSNPQFEIKSTLIKSDDEVSLLLRHTQDMIVSSQNIDHPEIMCIPFIKDRLLLSVSQDNPLASHKELYLKTACPSGIDSIVIYDVGGVFLEMQQTPFWEKFCPDIKIVRYKDYFMFNQIIKDKKTITVSTELVQHFRDDGKNRKLIPIMDTELTIQYYLLFLKKNKERVAPFVHWTKQYADSFFLKQPSE